MDSINTHFQTLAELSNLFRKENVTDFNNIPEHLRDQLDKFESKLTEIIFKNKKEVSNVLIKIIYCLDLGIVCMQNGTAYNFDLISSFGNDSKIYFQLEILKTVLKIFVNNYAVFGDNLVDFSKLLDILLQNFDLMKYLTLELFVASFKLDNSLTSNDKVPQVLKIAICESDESHDAELIHKKKSLMLTLLNIFSLKKKVLQFHKWFHLATESVVDKQVVFHKEFDSLYSETIFQLHFNQTLEIWNFFIESFSALNISHIHLFSKFLLHIRVLDSRHDFDHGRLAKMLNCTMKLVENIKLKNIHFLQIYHSIACLKYLLKSHDYNSEQSNVEQPTNILDLSILFPDTTFKQWEKIFKNFNNLDHSTKIVLIKLLIIHYKYCKSINLEQSSDILLDVVSKITSDESLIIYELLSFIISELDCSQMTVLMNYLFENLFDKESNQVNNSIEILYCNSLVWENINFHTIFVTCFIKKLSVLTRNHKRKLNEDVTIDGLDNVLLDLSLKEKQWIKYGQTAFDINSSVNKEKLAKSIDCSSKSIQIRDDRQTLGKQNSKLLLSLLKMFNHCVPLEYLSPINQLRSVITLTVLITFYDLKTNFGSDLVDLFVQISLRLWNSVRRIWLFDFVPPSDYIYTLLYYLQSKLDNRCYLLFNKFVENLYRLSDCEKSCQNVNCLLDLLTRNKHPISVDAVLMLQTIILKNNSQFMHKFDKNDNFKLQKNLFETISGNVSSEIYRNIKVFIEQTENMEQSDSVFVIEGFTKLFEYKIFQNISNGEETVVFKTKWKKLLSKFIAISNENICSEQINGSLVHFLKVVINNSNKLDNTLPENFLLDLWFRLIELSFHKVCRSLKKYSSESYWHKTYTDQSFHEKLSQFSKDAFQYDAATMSNLMDQYLQLFESIESLITPIIISSSEEEFNTILSSCITMLSRSDLLRSVFVVKIFNRISNSTLTLPKVEILNSNYSILMTSLMNIMNNVNNAHNVDNARIQLTIKVTILQSTKSLLTHLIDHNLLSNSHLFLTYNICIESSLPKYCANIEIFSSLFLIINGIVNEIITKRPHLAIFSMCTQINIINMLLVTLLTVSNESSLEDASHSDKAQLENCSKNFTFTLTQLANIEDFKPFVLHLIASYLQQSQTVSLIPLVKKHLSVGIFNLIDLVKSKDVIERFHSRLNQSSRELLKVHLDLYNKYHRFKGYV